jgi:hypothetical protein
MSQLGLDINLVLSQEEVIVDPLFPPAVVVVPEPDLFQVNENEEDAAIEEEPENENNGVQGQEQNIQLPEVQNQTTMDDDAGGGQVFLLEECNFLKSQFMDCWSRG